MRGQQGGQLLRGRPVPADVQVRPGEAGRQGEGVCSQGGRVAGWGDGAGLGAGEREGEGKRRGVSAGLGDTGAGGVVCAASSSFCRVLLSPIPLTGPSPASPNWGTGWVSQKA